MRGGIIAAGSGSRLQQQGISQPKPLIKIGDKTLLGWTVSHFIKAGIQDLVIIFNESIAKPCISHLKEYYPDIKFEFIIKTTRSSFESFYEVSSRLKNDPFVISTVDTIFHPQSFKNFIDFFKTLPNPSVVLGTTSFIDDEKPLYVSMDLNNKIHAIDIAKSSVITCGIYGFYPKSIAYAQNQSFTALRKFLKFVVTTPIPVFGHMIDKSIDVDRPADIIEAEKLIARWKNI